MTERKSLFRVSVVIVWLSAALAVWLGFHRPFVESRDLAESLPATVGAFTLVEQYPLTDREIQLLGTSDVTSRAYQAPDGSLVYVILVVHGANWKSVHPPEYCLRGSNMVILGSQLRAGEGQLTLLSRDRNENYVSVFRYGADGLSTGSYSEFAWHHMPRAVFRATVHGYLVRVETWAGRDDTSMAAADSRCRAFLSAAESDLNRIVQSAHRTR